MVYYLSFIFKYLKSLLSKPYKYLTILFFIWLYRVDFIPADGGGMAKILQVVTIFGILFLIYIKDNNIVRFTILRTNIPIKSLIIFYVFALMSTIWAFVPTFAFFLSFQNIVIILFLSFLNKGHDDFKSIEKLFLTVCITIIVFEYALTRILYMPNLFTHSLSTASSAAICFSYSFTELMTMKIKDKRRKQYLKYTAIFSVFVLITCTSSGANASAIFGLCTGLFFSGHIIYVFLILLITIYLYLNQHLIGDILLYIMPGKTKETIESATGRTDLWEIMIKLANEKPLFGWGYGCIERAATEYGDIESPDAHNNYLGVYGSLGYAGLLFFIYHLLISIIYSFKRKARPGFLGLFSGILCASLNGYSYGFLSGKACSITVTYFAIIVLTYYYGKIKMYDRQRVE